MAPKINQKPIRFISHYWSRGSHKTRTDRQHRHSLEKMNKVHIHLTVKTCSPAGKGGQEGAVSMLPRGQWAWGVGSRVRRFRHHS